MEQIAQVQPLAKGMGIAAPQIGIGRAAAVVQPPTPGAPAIVLVNPRITDRGPQMVWPGMARVLHARAMTLARASSRPRGIRPGSNKSARRPDLAVG